MMRYPEYGIKYSLTLIIRDHSWLPLLTYLANGLKIVNKYKHKKQIKQKMMKAESELKQEVNLFEDKVMDS